MFWLNDWVFLYTLSGCRFDSSCCHEKYYCVENALLAILKMFDTVVQQWRDCSTVTGTIIQQSLARFFISGWHNSLTVTCKIFFSFFYAGRILSCHVPGIRHMIPKANLKPELKMKVVWSTCDKELGGEMKSAYENYSQSSL